MKMTIARKLWLGLGILIIIYLVTGLAVLGSIRRMDQYLSEITKVDEPTNAAAYEMEINAIGTGMGV